jgi:hypothetical protein
MGWRQAWLGACLLLAGAAPARAAVITPEIVATFPTPGGSIKGLAWGDGSLWVADENKKIYRLSPTGTVEGSFSHTISDVSDLEWFEDSVWIHTGYNTYKLNSSGQIVETLNVAYWPGSGMAWAEGDLYLTDFNSAYVHKLTRAGSHVYSWSVGYSGGHPMAMTYDGSHRSGRGR